MITALVGIGILAAAAILWAWAYLRDRSEDGQPPERMIPPELRE